jgi:hypothetical protein
MPTPTANTRFIGIEKELVDLQKKRSGLVNEKTDDYSLSDLTSSFRKSAQAVLLSGGWSLVSGVYQQDVANADIEATSYVSIVPDNDDIPIVQASELMPQNESFNGFVRVYSTNEPASDINITLNIFI